MIIGICGGSGSGKTTLMRRLAEHYRKMNPSVFIMDNYYLPIEKQHRDENGVYNFDLPTALDEKKLSTNLQKLVLGESITVREYHFNAPPDKKVLVTIDPSDFLIVEGLFLFHYEGVREKLDFSIFIDVDPNIQLDRRIYRDQETRGYSHDAIIYQWENHVKPCYEKYLLPYVEDADFIFRNDIHADDDFVLLTTILDKKMSQITC